MDLDICNVYLRFVGMTISCFTIHYLPPGIDCIGHNGAGSCPNNDYNVPYTCDEGQNFCCTVSVITNTTFGNKDKYGYCVKDGSSTDNTRTTDCVKDGDVVRMPL